MYLRYAIKVTCSKVMKILGKLKSTSGTSRSLTVSALAPGTTSGTRHLHLASLPLSYRTVEAEKV